MMRLPQYNNKGVLSLAEFVENEIPKYAILSHRWGAEEATFEDLQKGLDTKKCWLWQDTVLRRTGEA